MACIYSHETSKLLQFLKNTFHLIFYHKYSSDFIFLLTQNITHCVLYHGISYNFIALDPDDTISREMKNTDNSMSLFTSLF